jgi:hypothetical protein
MQSELYVPNYVQSHGTEKAKEEVKELNLEELVELWKTVDK